MAVAAIGACDAGTAPGEGGTIEVLVTGLGGTAAGSVTVTDPSGGNPGSVTIPMPDADASGSSLGTATNVPPETFRIALTPPPSHGLTSPPFEDVTVVANTTVRATFTVQAVGALEVQVSGFNATPASAGTVAITLADGSPSGTSVSLPAPVSGASLGSNTAHPTGAHRVTYAPPAGHIMAEPTDFKDVTIPVGAAVRASFLVQPDVAPTTFAFTSAWTTALGDTVNAATDGNTWDNNPNGTPDRVTVIPAAGLGFPANMANVLAIRYEATTDGRFCGVNVQNGWVLPGVGGVLCFRMYFRMSIDGTFATTHHPVQAAFQGGTCPFAAEWVMNKGPLFRFELATLKDGSSCNPNTDCHRWVIQLSLNTTYRMEERYERTGTNTWRMHARVYDSAGVQVLSDANFQCNQFGHGGHTLANHGNIVTPDPNCLRHKMIVNQGGLGSRGADAPLENRIFYGGFAVSLVDWCGPYTPGE